MCDNIVKLIIGTLMVSCPIGILVYFLTLDPFNRLHYSESRVIDLDSLDSLSVNMHLTAIIRTSSGPIQGKIETALNRKINVFLGIPYAEAPTGKARFKRTTSKRPWQKVIRTVRFRPPCLQNAVTDRVPDVPWVSNQIGTEDCLHINVWTPISLSNSSDPLRPVMVWIHGGMFASGSSDVKYYNGITLAAFGDIVVVSFNYRVGVFGFLNMGNDHISGNMGLYDQVLALRWIRQNIHVFGGDPSQITLFGQNTGASSIGFHLISPMSKDLFHRAILQSGSPMSPHVLEDPLMNSQRVIKFLRKTGCLDSEKELKERPRTVADCLQRKEASTLLDVAGNFIDGLYPPFVARVGDEFLPINPHEAIRGEKLNPSKALLIGSNKDEGSLFLHWTFPKIFTCKSPKNVTYRELTPLVHEAFKALPDPGPKLISHFFIPANLSLSSQLRHTFYQTIGDFLITCPSVLFSEQISVKNIQVYYYYFTHRPANSTWGKWMGATHFDEVPFVFGLPLSRPQHYTQKELEFSARIMEAWILFARTGSVPSQLGKKWPLYKPDERSYMELNPKRNSIGVGPHDHNCNLWRFMFQTVTST